MGDLILPALVSNACVEETHPRVCLVLIPTAQSVLASKLGSPAIQTAARDARIPMGTKTMSHGVHKRKRYRHESQDYPLRGKKTAKYW